MTRHYRHSELMKISRAKRAYALDRVELRQPSTPRTAPSGAVSMPIKLIDPETRALIDEALKRKCSVASVSVNNPKQED